jgi:hypothetical protein
MGVPALRDSFSRFGLGRQLIPLDNRYAGEVVA